MTHTKDMVPETILARFRTWQKLSNIRADTSRCAETAVVGQLARQIFQHGRMSANDIPDADVMSIPFLLLLGSDIRQHNTFRPLGGSIDHPRAELSNKFLR